MKENTCPRWILRSGYADFYISRAPDATEKIKQLLNFLKEETYSDFKTLMLLLVSGIINRFIRCWQKLSKWG